MMSTKWAPRSRLMQYLNSITWGKDVKGSFHKLIVHLLDRRTGVLGNLEIMEALASGQITISPFDERLLGSSSYDVRLGGNYYLADASSPTPIFSPFDEDSVRDYYIGPKRADTAWEYCKKHHLSTIPGVDPAEYIIVLQPGECILAHTIEYIGAAYGMTTMMKAKSSIGRVNVSACDDAGWGDVGYRDRWTFEIRNKNKVAVVLVVGMPIAQIVFLWVHGASIDYSESGHYQTSNDIAEIQATPITENMLPRLWSEKNRQLRRGLSPEELF